MSDHRPRFVLPAFALGLLASASQAQSVLHSFVGDDSFDLFGCSVAGAGDVNGDGFPDLVVGAFKDDNNGLGSGSARVFSGKDGTVLYTFDGDSSGDFFGYSVSGAGDVNQDGYDDVIVGALQDDDTGYDSGSARVHSGKDGSVLYEFVGEPLLGPAQRHYFGYSVSGAGDVNGDGFPDLIVGAPWGELGAIDPAGNKTFDNGLAYVYSGADGSLLHKLRPRPKKPVFKSNVDRFGYAVSGAGDVDGDGYDDVVVGSPSRDLGGAVSVFSGIDGKHLFTIEGKPGYALGISVSGAGDVNGDGHADFIAGGLTSNIWDNDKGIARVYSGADGSVLHTFWGDKNKDWLGFSVGGAGDVDGDGYDDLVVGAPRAGALDQGKVKVLSGRDGSLLHVHVGPGADDRFGFAAAGAGDVNGDGFADIVVGAYVAENAVGFQTGRAWVISGCDVLGTTYCSPAVPNSTGLPATITACGNDAADGGYFRLHARQLPPMQFGYFLTSLTQGFVANPGGSQGNLCLGGTIGRFNAEVLDSGAKGAFVLAVDLGALPPPLPPAVQPGETWNFQAWYRDTNPGKTSNFTDGVSVGFQ